MYDYYRYENKYVQFDYLFLGIYLLFLPGAWSIAMATEAGHLPDFFLLSKFFLGSVLMRGAGCIVNDMLDVKFDKKVRLIS